MECIRQYWEEGMCRCQVRGHRASEVGEKELPAAVGQGGLPCLIPATPGKRAIRPSAQAGAEGADD